MKRRSSLTLLAISIVFTLSLLGLSTDWGRIGHIAPFGDSDLAPFLFVPLLLASAYAGLCWFGVNPSLPTVAVRAAAILGLAGCLVVIAFLPAEPATKLIISSLVVAFVVTLQICLHVVRRRPVNRTVTPKMQFSLRALLALVFLFSILARWRAPYLRSQAIARNLGAECYSNETDSNITIREAFDVANSKALIEASNYLPNPCKFTFYRTTLPDDEMRHFVHAKNIRVIVLADTTISDNGLRSLSKIASLERIDLIDGERISNAKLASFKRLRPSVKVAR